MDYMQQSLKKHREWKGKIEVVTPVPLKNKEDLSLAYTPGVAQPCLEIQKDPALSYELTRRWNLCCVVSDGTAVLGLGDIGPEASMPVMEGKSALFKALGDVDAFPLCVQSREVDTIVETIYQIHGSFGGINLEDIAAPRCFEIEEKLQQRCYIPVFHDDQHGTAVVVVAALLNALRVVNKEIGAIRVVVSGAGAAGIAISKLLLHVGVRQLTMCDIEGAVYPGRPGMNPWLAQMAEKTNPGKQQGNLAQLLCGADVFIGVSAPGIVTGPMVADMANDAIVFAMANPTPEVSYEDAVAAGAAVVGTGRSDFPNQINNVLAFPGIFRGALDVRARCINDEMKMAAAMALSSMVPQQALSAQNIMPAAFDPLVAKNVAAAVAQAARDTGVSRV